MTLGRLLSREYLRRLSSLEMSSVPRTTLLASVFQGGVLRDIQGQGQDHHENVHV